MVILYKVACDRRNLEAVSGRMLSLMNRFSGHNVIRLCTGCLEVGTQNPGIEVKRLLKACVISGSR